MGRHERFKTSRFLRNFRGPVSKFIAALKLPHFENENEHLAAQAIDAFLLLGLTAILVSWLGGALLNPGPSPTAELLLYSLIILLAALAMLRLRFVMLTAWAVILGGWAVMAGTLIFYEGYDSINTLGHMLLIFMAGLVLFPNAAFVLATLSMGVSIYAYFVEPPFFEGIPHSHNPYQLVTVGVYYYLAAILVGVVRRRMNRMLGRVQRNDLLYRALFTNMAEAVVVLDIDRHLIQANTRACDLLGYPLEELLGLSVDDLVDEAALDLFKRYLPRVLESEVQPVYELNLVRKDGRLVSVEASTALVLDEYGEPLCIQNILRDISPRKLLEEDLQRRANFDDLTGLMSRAQFEAILARAVPQAQRDKSRLGLLFIDIDNLKSINDALGHPAGDAYLRAVAERMARTVRGGDVLARLSGDEFVVLVETLQSVAAAKSLAQRILETIAQPLEIAGKPVDSSCSIGISLFPHHATEASGLKQAADLAMYAAKRAGKNRAHLYDEALGAVLVP